MSASLSPSAVVPVMPRSEPQPPAPGKGASADGAREITESQFEMLLLCYWLARVRDLESVTVVVRRNGSVVRSVVIEPGDLGL